LGGALNNGDVFILDAGLTIYTFIGEFANAFEKMKGGAIAHNLVAARQGKSKTKMELDEQFWSILGGSSKDVQPASEHEETEADKPMEADKCKLFRLSDASGKIAFTKEAEGRISQNQLDTNDAFIVDCGIEIFVWIGKGASASEKQQCMKYAMEYLKSEKKVGAVAGAGRGGGG
jgi:hypothetical protein